MRLRWRARTLPKAGSEPGENEDAYRVKELKKGKGLRVAVADGATDSIYSAEWATALVTAWTRTRARDLKESLIERARRDWQATIPPGERLPWYALARLEEGSYATAAFLEIWFLEIRQDGPVVAWTALTIGDCLIVVRRTGGRSTVPSEPMFNSRPKLLASVGRSGVGDAERVDERTNRFREIWIATDALAEALLRRSRGVRWQEWRDALEDEGQFRWLVARWRDRGILRNDDVTLVRIWAE